MRALWRVHWIQVDKLEGIIFETKKGSQVHGKIYLYLIKAIIQFFLLSIGNGFINFLQKVVESWYGKDFIKKHRVS